MVRTEGLIATTGMVALWALVLSSCTTVTDGPALIMAGSSGATSSSTGGLGAAGGMGGKGGDATSHGGGMGGDGGGIGTGGMGGSGGAPEKPLHGCLSSTATDMTGQTKVDLLNPLVGPYCLKVSLGTTVTIDGAGQLGTPMILGGEVKMGVKLYDKQSPIQPSCYNCNQLPSCFDPNSASCYQASSWSLQVAGAYPFYDNSSPMQNYGAVYVIE